MTKLCIGTALSLLILAVVDQAHWTTWFTCANGWATLAIIVRAITGGR